MTVEKDDCRSSLAVVLPSLDPDDKFDRVVEELVCNGFSKIVIVDDGSDSEHQKHFIKAAEYSQCIVLHHNINKGKGRALKTAFKYVLQNCTDTEGVITIDGDGQHLLKDIIACGNRMLGDRKVVLGCRDFSLPNVPPRSVAGNRFTSKAFRILFGIELSDTQTGLRAIPKEYLEMFCEIPGERFEYETNMLLQMHRTGVAFEEQSIETVYDPEDYSSHYNAIKDSWKVGKVMLRFLLSGSGIKYVFSSVISLAADYGIYFILLSYFGTQSEATYHLFSTFSSSVLNFLINKFWVFGKKGDLLKEFVGYYCICIPRTLISTFFASFTIHHLQTVNPGLAVMIRIVVDSVLFFASYFLQKKLIFKKKQ